MTSTSTHAAVALAAALALGAGSAARPEPGKLLVWINGDKGYNGLQKVGDEFAKKTGVQVTVRAPRRRARQVPAGRRRRQGPGHLVLAARPRRRVAPAA